MVCEERVSISPRRLQSDSPAKLRQTTIVPTPKSKNLEFAAQMTFAPVRQTPDFDRFSSQT
jgi:hypothetical protein